MTWIIINDADNTIVGDGQALAELPDPMPDGAHAVLAPINYGFETQWSAELNGFIAMGAASPPISAMQFKLLFTPSEHLAIMAAAPTDPMIRYYLDLINTPGGGIDLTHPVVTGGVAHVVAEGYVTEDRGQRILSGLPPE